METNTILSLYNGDCGYIEKHPPRCKRYTENLSKCTALEDKLRKLVDEDIFDLITKTLEHQGEFLSVEIEVAFVDGFSLATSLLLEAIAAK